MAQAHVGPKSEAKAYILLYACSLAVYVDLVPNLEPELEPNHIQDYDLQKRAKYLGKCKDAVWFRWTKEYLRGLRERHRLKHKDDSTHPAVGDVVIIKSDEKNRAQWKLGVLINLIIG